MPLFHAYPTSPLLTDWGSLAIPYPDFLYLNVGMVLSSIFQPHSDLVYTYILWPCFSPDIPKCFHGRVIVRRRIMSSIWGWAQVLGYEVKPGSLSPLCLFLWLFIWEARTWTRDAELWTKCSALRERESEWKKGYKSCSVHHKAAVIVNWWQAKEVFSHPNRNS